MRKSQFSVGHKGKRKKGLGDEVTTQLILVCIAAAIGAGALIVLLINMVR